MAYFVVGDDEDFIDIDPIDFIEQCTSLELGQLVDILIRMGHLDQASSANEEMFNESLYKIIENKHRLTIQEEEIIEKIANRL